MKKLISHILIALTGMLAFFPDSCHDGFGVDRVIDKFGSVGIHRRDGSRLLIVLLGDGTKESPA